MFWGRCLRKEQGSVARMSSTMDFFADGKCSQWTWRKFYRAHGGYWWQLPPRLGQVTQMFCGQLCSWRQVGFNPADLTGSGHPRVLCLLCTVDSGVGTEELAASPQVSAAMAAPKQSPSRHYLTWALAVAWVLSQPTTLQGWSQQALWRMAAAVSIWVALQFQY